MSNRLHDRASWPILVFLAAFGGCARPETPAPSSPLSLAAASDLQNALPEVIEAYKADHQGQDVIADYGASGKFAEQIKAGAPFDVFLAANESFVKGLVVETLIEPESVRPYAVGSLVMAVRSEVPGAIESVADLLEPGVKLIAIANPDTAPYGAAARQALQKAGVWDDLKPKLVPAESVRQAFQFVETGNADVAFVGRALTKGRDLRVVAVDPKLYDPIVQVLGIVSRSKRPSEAEQFARFLTGPKGQAVLKTFGFTTPVATLP